ncbi:unnamed protein product [Schistosoma turkestanicum]|nr:unnamed protein product [Schistosoma turkestanicum]
MYLVHLNKQQIIYPFKTNCYIYFKKLPIILMIHIIYMSIWNINTVRCSSSSSSSSSSNHERGIKKLRLQSLDIESCLPIGDSFCTEKVPNSFCSIEKNECFCKYGHYLIQEDDGFMCKTLLTNEKCQLDSDCIYVKHSICHPGAGACICPSGTIYVPEEHACRFQIKTVTNDFCQTCKHFHGLCYRYEHDDQEYSEFKERNHYGCKCPYNTVSINTNILWNKSYIYQSQTLVPTDRIKLLDSMNENQKDGICRGLLVDIGMFCNQIDMLCRSSNAFCSNGKMINNVYISPQCVCRDGYLPVYQDYLDYHECNFSGTQQNFTIYLNFSTEYQSSIFLTNDTTHWIIFMSNQLSSVYPRDNCLLKKHKDGIWRKMLNFSEKHDILTDCALIQIHHQKRELTFKTYIIVLYQSIFDFTIKHKQYYASFTLNWNKVNVTFYATEIQMININNEKRDNSEILKKLHQNLKFTSTNNELNSENSQTMLNTKQFVVNLRIDYSHQNSNCLLDSNQFSKEIKFHSNHLSTFGNFDILLNNSINSINNLLKNMTDLNSSQQKDWHFHENFTILSELHINCVFRVCQHNKWCTWPSCDNTNQLDYNLPQPNILPSYTSYPSILTLTKSLKIEIPNLNSTSPLEDIFHHSLVFTQNKSTDSNCEPNTIHVKFFTTFIIFIIFLISGISLIIFYCQFNCVIYQTPCNWCYRQLFTHRSNHKKYSDNKFIHDQITTYNLCSSNPLNTKMSQPVIYETDSLNHSKFVNTPYNPMNHLYQTHSQQNHHCSQLHSIQLDYLIKNQTDMLHDKNDHFYKDTTDFQNPYNNNNQKNIETWDNMIPVYYNRNSNSNDKEFEHCSFESDKTYPNHIHPFDFNEIHANKSLSLTSHTQQDNIFMPSCLHNQTLGFLQPNWYHNIEKYETTLNSMHRNHYQCLNNNFYNSPNFVTVKNDLFLKNKKSYVQK